MPSNSEQNQPYSTSDGSVSKINLEESVARDAKTERIVSGISDHDTEGETDCCESIGGNESRKHVSGSKRARSDISDYDTEDETDCPRDIGEKAPKAHLPCMKKAKLEDLAATNRRKEKEWALSRRKDKALDVLKE